MCCGQKVPGNGRESWATTPAWRDGQGAPAGASPALGPATCLVRPLSVTQCDLKGSRSHIPNDLLTSTLAVRSGERPYQYPTLAVPRAESTGILRAEIIEESRTDAAASQKRSHKAGLGLPNSTQGGKCSWEWLCLQTGGNHPPGALPCSSCPKLKGHEESQDIPSASRAHSSNKPLVRPPSESFPLFQIKTERLKILCGTGLPFSVHPRVSESQGNHRVSLSVCTIQQLCPQSSSMLLQLGQ